MILDLLFALALLIVGGILAIIPAFSMPELGDSGAAMGSAVAAANGLFPVVTLGLCIGAVLLTWVFTSIWAYAVYVYRLIPFKLT